MVIYEAPNFGRPPLPKEQPPKRSNGYFTDVVSSPTQSYYSDLKLLNPVGSKVKAKCYQYKYLIALCSCLLLSLAVLLFFFILYNPWASDDIATGHPQPPLTVYNFTMTTGPPKKQREIKIYNKCTFTIWPGIQGPGNPEGGGFQLKSGETRNIHVDDDWKAAKIWARTECDPTMNCATGWCADSEKCNGAGGIPPVTLAEFNLRGDQDLDFYDVSLVDGYNIPILIDPLGGQGNCQRAGGCVKDINDVCPKDLAVKKDGRTIACKSGCLAYYSDEECCRGAFGTVEKCPQSRTARIFKDACPTTYSYAFDSVNSSFTCKGAHYVVQFC